MSSSAMRVVAVILGVFAIILTVVAWRMSQNYADSAEKARQQSAQAEQKPAVPQIMVVVATKPLGVNVPIEANDVVLAPVTVAPTEYFANVEDVIGRTPLVDLDAGQPITPRFFKDTNQIARRVPPGQRALSLKVDDVVGVGGFVRPGDIVDVLVFIKSTTDTPTGVAKGKSDDVATQARMLLKDVLVISYEEHLVEPPKGIEKQDPNKQAQQQRRERTAVVAVPEEQVQRVLLGASVGDLRLSLHGTQTADAASAAPADAAAAAAAPISAVTAPADAKGDAKAKPSEPPPDGVITMLELTRLRNVKNGVGPIPPPKPTVQVIRGSESKREPVYP